MSRSTRAGPSNGHRRRSPSTADEDRERERRRAERQRQRDRGGRGEEHDAADQAIEGHDMESMFDPNLPTLEKLRDLRKQQKEREEGRGDRNDRARNDDEEDERFLWTVDNFEDVAVNKEAAEGDLREARNYYTRLGGMIQKGIEEIIENARDYETVAPDHGDIDKLQADLIKLLDTDKEREVRLGVVNDLLVQLRQGTTVNNIEREVQDRADAQLAEWRAKTLRQKYNQNDLFKEFRTAVWNVNHDDEPIPPMSRWLEREDDDPESDDEIEAGGTMQTYRCPISLTVFTDACKSTVCGHHYSYAAIMSHISASARNAAKCPVGACNRQLTKADIQRDPRMQKEANAFVARQQRREAAQEDEVFQLEDD